MGRYATRVENDRNQVLIRKGPMRFLWMKSKKQLVAARRNRKMGYRWCSGSCYGPGYIMPHVARTLEEAVEIVKAMPVGEWREQSARVLAWLG